MTNVSPGDLVQIRVGAMDVTNGIVAKSGWKFVDGSSIWATVDQIIPNWKTSGENGLPATVTKIRCTDGSTVVWQVQPDDIISYSDGGTGNNDALISLARAEAAFDGGGGGGTSRNKNVSTSSGRTRNTSSSGSTITASSMKATTADSTEWNKPSASLASQSSISFSESSVTPPSTKLLSEAGSPFEKPPTFTYEEGTERLLNAKEKKSIGGAKIKVDETGLKGPKFQTVMQDPAKRAHILNSRKDIIQNNLGFPALLQPANEATYDTAKYDYQIIPGDPRYAKMTSLEDLLMKARAAFGIPVHGDNMIARSMKYYLYDRYKHPDINLAHNKTFTHVFFSRPDLNLMSGYGGVVTSANSQVMNHSEAAMIWRRYPDIFKLLTKGSAARDSNNFNLLLSNAVSSFDIQDESLSHREAGKSWKDHAMLYGDIYSGKTSGEFSCNFTDTADLSIINLMKLWITYIDNVSHGAWKPSYNLSTRQDSVGAADTSTSYVHQRALDYAASCYVFKVGPGEEILYWSKYYGVFPGNTGASALSWDNDTPVGSTPKLNIRFKYCWKADCDPVSLMEFNRDAYVSSGGEYYEPSFNADIAQCVRPYVGAPFIGMQIGTPRVRSGGVDYNAGQTKLRLLFRPASVEDSAMNDGILYRAENAKKTDGTLHYVL